MDLDPDPPKVKWILTPAAGWLVSRYLGSFLIVTIVSSIVYNSLYSRTTTQTSKILYKIKYLKGEFTNFFIGLYDGPKYDFIWTKNENLMDRFLPEIITANIYFWFTNYNSQYSQMFLKIQAQITNLQYSIRLPEIQAHMANRIELQFTVFFNVVS